MTNSWMLSPILRCVSHDLREWFETFWLMFLSLIDISVLICYLAVLVGRDLYECSFHQPDLYAGSELNFFDSFVSLRAQKSFHVVSFGNHLRIVHVAVIMIAFFVIMIILF